MRQISLDTTQSLQLLWVPQLHLPLQQLVLSQLWRHIWLHMVLHLNVLPQLRAMFQYLSLPQHLPRRRHWKGEWILELGQGVWQK